MSGIHKFVMDNLESDEDYFNFGSLIAQKTLWSHFQETPHHNKKYDSQKAFYIESGKLLRLSDPVRKNVKKRGGKGYSKLKCFEMPERNECIRLFNETYGDDLVMMVDDTEDVGEIIEIIDNTNPVKMMAVTPGSMM